MALLSRKPKPETAVDPTAILRQLAKDRRAAWDSYRTAVKADRDRQRRENAKAIRAGKFVVPLSMLIAELPDAPPAWWGALEDGSDALPQTHDRNGNPIHAGEDGRVQRTETPQPALGSHPETFHFPGGIRELEVQDGQSGDEHGELTHRIDPAAVYADLHRVSLEDARAMLAEDAE